MQTEQAVSVEQVLATIRAVLSVDAATREPAEASLRSWEADAVPGFLIALVNIVRAAGQVDEGSRMMAAVLAKNAVGSSWRKTLGSREWSRVPAAEQAAVREAALQLLASDPNDRVAVQVAELIANIARFDFPQPWADLVAQLLAGADWGSPVEPPRKLRALRALKPLFRALATKRFIISTSGGPMTPSSLQAVTQAMHAERTAYKAALAAAVAPLHTLVSTHLTPFMAGAEGWAAHAAFAKAALAALSDLLPLIPSQAEMPAGSGALLEALASASGAIANGAVPGAVSPAEGGAWQEAAGRLYEAGTRCVTAHMDAFPLPFAQYLPFFLSLYVDGALIRLDAATLRAMRAKRRVLLVRFLVKALLSAYYSQEWVDTRPGDHGERARAAAEALSSMLGGPQCPALVQALVAKYIALTPEELEEWVADPEGYVRSMDLETGPDADTPRPVGMGLLLCMLERGGEAVARALLGLAAQLQAQQMGPETALLREAVYRSIGEGYPHVSPFFSFDQWYASELAPQLTQRLPDFRAGTPDIMAAMMQARALWLVGACAGPAELPEQQWRDGLALCVAYMGVPDLVVALTAVHAVLLMVSPLLEDQTTRMQLEQSQRDLQRRQAAAAAKEGVGSLEEAEEGVAFENILLEEEHGRVSARIAWRLAALQESMQQLLGSCFALLARLQQVESSVRLLQLVSVVTEAAGASIEPHLGAIANALPQVWEAASAKGQRRGAEREADDGSLARLHSALMAVLTHLVGKLRGRALASPQLQAVVYPLLEFAVSARGPEAEVLLEEGLKLWLVVLGVSPQVPPQLLPLLPHMGSVLRRGRDNTMSFQILEGYLLLGAGPALTQYSETIAAALADAAAGPADAMRDAVAAAAAASASGAPGGGGGMVSAGAGPSASQAASLVSSETAQASLAASALADTMLQLFPADAPALLAPAFRHMAALVASDQFPGGGLPMKLVNVMEGYLEVLARLIFDQPAALSALLPPEAPAPAAAALPNGAGAGPAASPVQRLLDRWLSIAGTQFIEELIGVRHMAMMGRFRRRIGALSLCAVARGGGAAAQQLLAPPGGGERVARLAGLMVKVMAEGAAFAGDVIHLDSMDFESELGGDWLLAARLALSRRDPVRSVELGPTFQATLAALASGAGGVDALVEAVAAASSERLAAQVRHLADHGALASPAQLMSAGAAPAGGGAAASAMDGS